MKNFLLRFGAAVAGVLHGFDRLRFRGSKRQLCHVAGMMSWLGHLRIPLKEYKTFARDTTVSLCRSIEGPAVAADIYEFLNNSRDSKEEMALQIAAKQKRTSGLIAVLGCVEPCQVMQVRGNRETEKLELKVEPGKCKHYYHYYLDPVYGLRYTRLQSWFPFTMHIGLNGRDWLAQQMNKAGIAYRKLDNCFAWVDDFAAAETKENAPDGPEEYLRMRQGVVDLPGRAEVSQEINARYADSLATVEDKTSLADLTKDLGKRTAWKGRSVRALNPLADDDVRLLEAVSRGDFLISGFRNRDLRGLLFADLPTKPAEVKTQSAKVTRLLRLLRAHGLIDKIAKSHRYQATETGMGKVTALLAARHANTKQLLSAA